MSEIHVSTLARRKPASYVIDVREPSEFATGSVPGAISIPAGELRNRFYEVPRGSTVYLVCANGARSLDLVPFMRAIGYDAHSVTGGMWPWLHHDAEPTAEGH